MNPQSVAQLIRRDLKCFGPRKTCYDVLVRTVNRAVFFKILNVMSIEAVNRDYLDVKQAYHPRFLNRAELHEFAKDPDYDMTEAFLDAALAKGDECFGVFDGPVLASYGWYSNTPTETSDELTIRVSADYTYMYKAFTHPKYRGRRLHAISINRALEQYLRRGYKGFISYVESNNFSSLKSVYRMGYHDFGRVAILKIGSQPLIIASRGSQQYGLHFRRSCVAGRSIASLSHAHSSSA